MTSKLILFLLLILFILSCNDTITNSFENENTLKEETSDKIKMIIGKRYLAILDKNGIIVKGEQESSFLKKYNKREKLEEDVQYNFDGKIKTKKVVLYSENEIMKIFDSEGELIEKLVITRDEKNNITDTEFHPNGGEKSHMYSIYEYDENENILVETNGLKKSSLSVSKTKHEYDKKGNSILQKRYNYLDGLTNITKNQYDKKGNRIQFEVFRLPLEKAANLKYQSNSKEEDLTISYSGETKYDSQNNIISYTSFDHDKGDKTIAKKDSFSYEYDKMGNWIKKVEFEKNTPKMIIERTIEYYEK